MAQKEDFFWGQEVGSLLQHLPISERKVGFYSVAGIEPSEFDDSGVVRRTNHDRAWVATPLYREDGGDVWFGAGICDGLGLFGDGIASYVSKELVASLRRHQLRTRKPELALKEAFLECDDTLRNDEQIRMNAVGSGTTALMVVVHKFKLWCAWCGDCGAVLGRRTVKAGTNPGDKAAVAMAAQGGGVLNDDGEDDHFDLEARKITREHTPTDLRERARCLDAGAHVSQPTEPGLADARLWRNPEMTEIGITLSRSIGHHGARSVGVIPDPEVKEIALTVLDQFVILGSDGLWTFVEPQEAVELVAFEMAVAAGSFGSSSSSSSSSKKKGKQKNVRGTGGADRAAERLVELASQRWAEEEDDFRDDVSVVVVALPLHASQADMHAAMAKQSTTKERKEMLRTKQRANSKEDLTGAEPGADAATDGKNGNSS